MSPEHAAARLRAVLDTNIYISAFQFPRGRNAALWRAARERRFALLVSPPIVQEVARVLRREFHWQDGQVQAVIRRIAEVAGSGIVNPKSQIAAVEADPDDNRILECAVTGKADVIVSNDHHLLQLRSWDRIPILGSVDFRRMLGLF